MLFEGPFGLLCSRQSTTKPPRLGWWCGWVIDIIIGIVLRLSIGFGCVGFGLCEPRLVARVVSSRDSSRVTARLLIILGYFRLLIRVWDNDFGYYFRDRKLNDNKYGLIKI